MEQSFGCQDAVCVPRYVKRWRNCFPRWHRNKHRQTLFGHSQLNRTTVGADKRPFHNFCLNLPQGLLGIECRYQFRHDNCLFHRQHPSYILIRYPRPTPPRKFSGQASQNRGYGRHSYPSFGMKHIGQQPGYRNIPLQLGCWITPFVIYSEWCFPRHVSGARSVLRTSTHELTTRALYVPVS